MQAHRDLSLVAVKDAAAGVQELAPQDTKGGYQRPSYAFGGRIGKDDEWPAVAGRYHLYVGNACPWCHRVLLALALLGLDGVVSHSWLTDDAERASRGGWIFDAASTGRDPVFGAADLRCVGGTLSRPARAMKRSQAAGALALRIPPPKSCTVRAPASSRRGMSAIRSSVA